MNEWPPPFDLDLGDNHGLTWVVAGQEDRTRIGAVIYHHANTETGWCAGGVRWASSTFEREHPDRLSEYERNRARWDLQGEPDEHLTLSPSVLCSCGDHGFIRNGRWERA